MSVVTSYNYPFNQHTMTLGDYIEGFLNDLFCIECNKKNFEEIFNQHFEPLDPEVKSEVIREIDNFLASGEIKPANSSDWGEAIKQALREEKRLEKKYFCPLQSTRDFITNFQEAQTSWFGQSTSVAERFFARIKNCSLKADDGYAKKAVFKKLNALNPEIRSQMVFIFKTLFPYQQNSPMFDVQWRNAIVDELETPSLVFMKNFADAQGYCSSLITGQTGEICANEFLTSLGTFNAEETIEFSKNFVATYGLQAIETFRSLEELTKDQERWKGTVLSHLIIPGNSLKS